MSRDTMSLPNTLRDKMEAGQLTVGMIVRLVRGVEIAAIAKTAGFDCLFIDLEHNGFSLETVTQICLASNMHGLTPLVRVASLDPSAIAQAFDCGAMGVIVPQIENAEDARNAVAAAKFPPPQELPAPMPHGLPSKDHVGITANVLPAPPAIAPATWLSRLSPSLSSSALS